MKCWVRGIPGAQDPSCTSRELQILRVVSSSLLCTTGPLLPHPPHPIMTTRNASRHCQVSPGGENGCTESEEDTRQHL